MLSWLADTQTPASYEISRNGNILKTVDGSVTGYIDLGLTAQTYQYQIVAIGDDGSRSVSTSASINLSTLQSAALHNEIRQALNNQSTLNNLGVHLDQSYDFSQEPKPSPALADMQDDIALQNTVEQYTSQCIYKHSGNGNGENLFAGTGSFWTLQHAIGAWANEAKDYDYTSNECATGQSCKHYTQMIWENTNKVACAVQACATISDGSGNTLFDGRSGTLIICQYAPAGNIIGSKPYRTENDTPPPETGIKLSLKTFLQGSYDAVNENMKDDLRASNHFSQQEPFSQLGHTVLGSLQLNPELLSIEGNNAIIDWVLFELRDKNNPATIIASIAALLQQDGNIADPLTGSSNISINDLDADDYYVAIRHRNHLGIMTAQAVSLSNVNTTIDFTDPNTAVWGSNARLISNGKAMMWAGDSNHDGKLIAAGPENDINSIFSEILLEPENTGFNSNYILSTYSSSDVNLDGKVIKAGDQNDENIIRGDVLLNPNNTSFSNNYIVEEQLPK